MSNKIYELDRQKVDPVTFEVIRHRLMSIVDEQAATLSAISGSPLVNEATDYNTGIFRANGETVAMGKTVLFHAASLSEMIKHIIADCEETIEFKPGDMFITNHPYKGSLHPPDFGLIAPIFHNNERVAWIGVCCHQMDVGGMAAGGSFPEAREVYQEGMLIAPIRAVENGEFRTDVLNMILGMSRLPTNMNLDFRGMLAANKTATARLQETIGQYSIDTILSVMDEALETTERAMRARIAELPDGIFRAQNYLDHDGRENKLYRIHLSLEKKGDRLIFDFSESAGQAPGFMNCTYGGLLAGVRAALLPILAYDLQWNEGVFRAIDVVAREGSIVSAQFPAACSQGPLGAVWLAELAAISALSKLVGSTQNYMREAQASPNGGPDYWVFHGRNQHGEFFHAAFLDMIYVGGGAYANHDGLSPQGHRHMPALRLPNVERNEQNGPVLYLYRKIMADTSGAGRHRGGNSAGVGYVLHGVEEMKMRMACHCYESPTATGLYGGHPAACNTRNFITNTNWRDCLAEGRMPFDTSELQGEHHTFPAKMINEVTFGAGDVYESCPSAGAGWGDPLEREPAAVASDVRFGEVSRGVARDIYGVAVRDDFSVDAGATESLRDAVRKTRLAWPVGESLKNAPDASAKGTTVAYHGDRATFDSIEKSVYFRCGCGAAIAPATENWKKYARSATATAAELGPRITLHKELEVTRYVCPSCARLLDIEVKRRNEPGLFDVELKATAAG